MILIYKLDTVSDRIVASLVGMFKYGKGLGTGESYIPVTCMFFHPFLHGSSCFPDVDFAAPAGNPVDNAILFSWVDGFKICVKFLDCVKFLRHWCPRSKYTTNYHLPKQWNNGRIKMHQLQPTFIIKRYHTISQPCCLKKTSSKYWVWNCAFLVANATKNLALVTRISQLVTSGQLTTLFYTTIITNNTNVALIFS